ncbi:MAG: antitoxin [Pelagibaca sp.]
MPRRLCADITPNVTKLKRDPMGTVAAAEGHAIAILNRNQAAFYCVPVAEYEAMLGKMQS